MNIMFDELDTSTPVLYPVRMVLNNKTLSIFSGENYNTVYRSYDLKYLKMTRNKIDPLKCFDLGDNRDAVKKSSVCILPEMLKPD